MGQAISKSKVIVHNLNLRQLCDITMLLNGSFLPLTTFMTRLEYESVVNNMSLLNGQPFGIPIILDTDTEYDVGEHLLFYETACQLTITEIFIPDKKNEALKVYGTESAEHPGVAELYSKGKYYITGILEKLKNYETNFPDCLSVQDFQTKYKINENPLIAFQTRNPIHKAHKALLQRVEKEIPNSTIIVHAVVGPTKSDDIDGFARIATYKALEKYGIISEYLPYNMHMAGPREALQHAIIRRNYGFTHMIVGRDHAGCKNASGVDFYGAYDAQKLLLSFGDKLGINIITSENILYCPAINDYLSESEAANQNLETKNISGTKFRQMLTNDEDIPDWFAYPEVVDILRKYYKNLL